MLLLVHRLGVGVLEWVLVGGRVAPGRARRRGRGRGWSAGGAGEKGLAAGLAQVDRVTFSTLKPTFSVVRE
eukprot:CAMPEP_0181249412 /NCGR_PEP_ID=MMETSP1096-20121128/45745_1 /TAXON_ID=156174 ORGANISM="Chrysochromulina ericina, Strain CCMP281" /NCGR_SAMPLE_ID=MMETSP1096 /ASSEMBLY_ACC=CAM_ASM_000453 /LENGTH=70 /DNA_ID=CAMNT_0023346757 /DNA_START=331 /DNA_END=543 /DNA_ORIENTATION=+